VVEVAHDTFVDLLLGVFVILNLYIEFVKGPNDVVFDLHDQLGERVSDGIVQLVVGESQQLIDDVDKVCI
jgi:hypothetical protein